MPIPHEEMRRIVRRRIRGLEGSERVRVLRACLDELPGYYQGPYGQLRKWILDRIEEAQTTRKVRHQDGFFLARQGSAQVVLVGAPNAGKSSLLHALTGRQVRVADYAFTTVRPVEGMVDVGGARVQMVDLPGLIEGASEGRGGGRAVVAAVRAADAVIHVAALAPGAAGAMAVVWQALEAGGVDLPMAVVATKADLADASTHLEPVRAASGGREVVVSSTRTGAGLADVRHLVRRLTGLIRVFCRPRGGQVAPAAVVLARGATVGALARVLHRDWVGQLRGARVTGTSARFAGQQVGIDHALADGDAVELLLT